MQAKAKRSVSRYRRVLLKLSGEVFQNPQTREPLDVQSLENAVQKISNVWKRGIQIAIVVGGGNIFRGLPAAEQKNFDRATGDHMGMLATLINALALQSALESSHIPARVMSALAVAGIAERFDRRCAREYLDQGFVVIFAAGTGNPFFTTDSAAALRAAEIGADALLKATKVDGIYDADPKTTPGAHRLEHITYAEALRKQLKIMDAAAFSLCMENRIPIIVFDFFAPDSVTAVLRNPKLGTIVKD